MNQTQKIVALGLMLNGIKEQGIESGLKASEGLMLGAKLVEVTEQYESEAAAEQAIEDEMKLAIRALYNDIMNDEKESEE